MKRVPYDESWPESWKLSHRYDEMEIHGDLSVRGYTYSYQCRAENALSLVREVAPPEARVLDIAAAQGNFSLKLAELGYDVSWNDLREDLVGYVQLKHEQGKLCYLVGNVFDLTPDEPFDVVLMTEIIEHVAHPDEFLRHVASLLRPGGHVVMTTPLGSYFRNNLPRFSECADPAQYEALQFKPNADGHIFLLHLDEIHDLAASAGLRVRKVSLASNPLTSGHVKLGILLKVLPKRLVMAIERGTRRLPRRLASRLHSNVAVLMQKADGDRPSQNGA